jgi:hypothetical protein
MCEEINSMKLSYIVNGSHFPGTNNRWNIGSTREEKRRNGSIRKRHRVVFENKREPVDLLNRTLAWNKEKFADQGFCHSNCQII